ncbi:MAG: phage baseplate assembly protein V [Desulfurococcaceae archaeon]
MIRVGKVVAVDDKNAKVRVQIEDADAVITYWLPVVHQKSQDDKHYWLPDIGELVVCAFYEDDWDTGFVLGAIYNDKDKPPAQTKDKFVIEFKDGTRIEYDRVKHQLHIAVKGDIIIEATGNMTLKATRIDLNP